MQRAGDQPAESAAEVVPQLARHYRYIGGKWGPYGATQNEPGVRLIVGAEDLAEGFQDPAARVQRALAEAYSDRSRVRLTVVEGMTHAFADEPGDRAGSAIRARTRN